MRLQPFSINSLKVVLLGALVFALDANIPHFSGSYGWAIADGLLHSSVIFTTFMGAVLAFRLSDDITKFVKLS